MPVSTSLRSRVPGQSVIGAIVAAQQDLAPRTKAARIFGCSPLTPSNRRLYRAALGELAVAEMLDQLGPRWDVLHVVPVPDDAELDGAGPADAFLDPAASEVPGAHIDHLVIGPPGVFALTTENYPGQEVRVSGDSMTIGGRHVDDILVARELASLATARLTAAAGRPIEVTPVIVVIDLGRLVVRNLPPDIMIVTSRQLIRTLTRLDRVLAGTEIADISDTADRTTTWDSCPTPPEAGLRLNEDFAVLRKQVSEAMRARVLWAVLTFVVVCAATWIGTAALVTSALTHQG